MASNQTKPVGVIVGPHGIKGQVKVDLYTDFVDRVAVGARLLLKGQWVQVERFLWHKDRPILSLTGVEDRNMAETLRGEELFTASNQKPELLEDDFLVEDLIGLKVYEGEELLGEVDDVLPYPAQDVLEVGELLIPLVKEFVKKIDVEAGRIEVALIPGMRPEEETDDVS